MYGLAWTKHLTTNAVSLIEENRKKRHERRKRESERDGVHERAGRMSEKKEFKQKLRKKKKNGSLNLVGLSLLIVLFLICWSKVS